MRVAITALVAVVLGLAAAAAATAPLPGAPACPVLPADNVWNRPVDGLPVLAGSDAIVRSVGLDSSLHPDFSDAGRYGIPVNVVTARTPKSRVRFDYADEANRGRYPIPADPPIERGGRPARADGRPRHLPALRAVRRPAHAGRLARGVRRRLDLRSNALRPAGWTSADAAGLPILPGLVRFDEVRTGAIDHALRFTAPRTRERLRVPGPPPAGAGNDPALPPMGVRVRLKASVDIAGFRRQARVVLTALKRYGMILADNGSPWYVSGAPAAGWDDDDLHGLGRITGADFEVVDTRGLRNGR